MNHAHKSFSLMEGRGEEKKQQNQAKTTPTHTRQAVLKIMYVKTLNMQIKKKKKKIHERANW